MALPLSPRQREQLARQDAIQSGRARVYLALSRLTAMIPARDFIEALADVADINARHALSRTHTKRERDEWRRLSEALHAHLVTTPDRID